MINNISFRNYKIFKKKQILEIRPITILIGKNNTGKSAILKLPTMIAGSLSGDFNAPIQLENDGVKIGNELRDIICGRNYKEIEIEIYQKNETNEDDFIRTEIFIDKDKPIIESWSCNKELDLFRLDSSIYLNKKNNQKYNVNFEGINIKNIKNTDGKLRIDDFLPLPNFLISTDFISAIRTEAKEFYSIESNLSNKSGVDGSKLYQFLIQDSQTINKMYFNKISNWLKEKFEGWELKIEVDGYRKELPALIYLEKSGLKINISQTGMGISQVLPLITRAYKPCEEETLIIIEEPESHLHPFAHAQIAQLFVDSLELDSNKKYLIETHSQNFVLRMRRLVTEGKLASKDIAIYYIDFDEKLNESNLKEIKVDNGGGVEWWPAGVFGETTLETRAIFNAQLNDLKNVD